MPRTRHVALIMNVAKPYDRGVVAGVADYVRAGGLWSLYVEDDPLTKMPHPSRWHGDGIIANLDDPAVVKAVRGLAIPVVGVGGGAVAFGDDPDLGLPYVATDDEAIGRMAADHLVECGLRRFAYCGVPRTPVNPWAARRALSFAGRLSELGFECDVYTGRHRTPRQWESLQASLTEWLRSLPTPLGLMACNDARARHVLEACRRINRRVPDDVAVIGVDNDEMLSDLSNPPLTSVIQGTARIGQEAAALLERLMRGEQPKRRRLVVEPVGIARRRSTDIRAATDALVARALGFIHDHIADRIQVEDVVAQAGVSRSTLDARLKRTVGRSTHEQIRHEQIRCARDLLAMTDLGLAQIARRAGFNNEQYLCSVFKSQTGVTPGAFRREAASTTRRPAPLDAV